MRDIELTSLEVMLLSVSGVGDTPIYELASASRLTPSEVLEGVRRLKRRDLAELSEDERTVRLTREGHLAQSLLTRQNRRIIMSHPTSEPRIIITDEDTNEQAAASIDTEMLDRAIDAELKKLEVK